MLSRFPYAEPLLVDDTAYTASEIARALGPMLSEARRARIDAVTAARSYTAVPVLEGLYDRGNASAVLRTAEALGYGAVHLAALQENWKTANRVTQGAEKWLEVFEWPTTREALEHLRARGYRNYAMVMDNAAPLGTADFTQPAALWFGSERDGLSAELLHACDARLTIPMTGFSQSFNISVAAALALYHARYARGDATGDLSEAERKTLRAVYYLRCFDNPGRLLRELLAPARREDAAP